jgi:uncharacterized protein YbjT (DUF2867 family)
MTKTDFLPSASGTNRPGKDILLIIGATGAQGGATIRALQAVPNDHWHLRAIVRNPDSERAKALTAKGVEIVKGDLDNDASVRAAMTDVYGVFSVQSMEGGPDVEERQGRIVAKMAADAGVQHFIYSSVGGAERNSGVPHFESKHRIERHIAAFDLPATIFRPVAFMDNFATFQFRTMMLSMWKTYMADDRTLQLIATDDIGWFVARAFAQPATHKGQQIELAGDAVTRQEAVHILRQANLTPALGFKIPVILRSKAPEEFRLMFNWFAHAGYQADIDDLRRHHPGLRTLEAWAKRTGKRSNAQLAGS